MVKVIYNLFSRTPRNNTANPHWLQLVVEGFKELSKTTCTIRVDADMHTNWSAYKVRNTINKMKAVCYNKEGFIFIEIYELPTPDVTQHLKPTFTDFIAHGKFINNTEGIKEASQFLANYLEIENEYFRNQQPRIALTPKDDLTVKGEVFLGGLLVDYDYDPTCNKTEVTIIDPANQYNNPTKHTYVLEGPLRMTANDNSLIGKYIIINSVNDYLYMSKPIISMYYKFA